MKVCKSLTYTLKSNIWCDKLTGCYTCKLLIETISDGRIANINDTAFGASIWHRFFFYELLETFHIFLSFIRCQRTKRYRVDHQM